MEKITEERDAVVAAKDNLSQEVGVFKELNRKLAETQESLQSEIAKLVEASKTAAAEIEGLKKKNEDDIAKLQSEHASVV